MSVMKKQASAKKLLKCRIISLLSVLFLLISQTSGLTAFAETTPVLILEMDLSAYDGTAASVSDGTGNGGIFSQSAHVRKGTFRNAAGNDVPYVDLYQEGNKRGRAWIKADISEGLESETISFWARIATEGMDWGVIVAKVNGMNTDSSCFEVDLNSQGIWVRPSGNYSNNLQSRLPMSTGEWTHITFTRQWSGNTVTWKTYINGVLQDESSCTGSADMTKELGGYDIYSLSTKFGDETEAGTLTDFATFQVYDGALSDSEIVELYENSYQDFEEFDGTFAQDGVEISIHERELLVDLPSGLEAEEAIASITMTDEDGVEPEGGIDVSLIGSTIARVRFGKLKANTTYTITGGRDGDLTVVTGGDYLLNEDFELWETGPISFTEEELQQKHAKRGDLTFGHSDNNLSDGNYTIESGDGGHFLTAGANVIDINASVGYKLDSPLVSGDVIYEMKVKPNNPGGSILPISKLWGDNIGSGYHFKDKTLDTEYKRSTAFNDFKKDSNGFWNMQCTLSVKKITETSAGAETERMEFSIIFKDKLSDRQVFFSKIVNADSKVGAIELVSVYTNGDASDSISIDDILVYNVSKLDVVTYLEGFDPAKKEIQLILSDEVSDESLEKNLITLEGNGKTIHTKLVEKNGRIITLKLSEHLEYNTEYSLSLSGLSLSSGEIVDTSEVTKFKTKAYEVSVNAVLDGKSATVSMDNKSGDERDILILLVGYSDDGIVCEVVPTEVTLFSGDDDACTITLNGDAAKTDLFIWDITTGMKPIPREND